ncbi:MAG TPA: hypothetical protein VFV75_03560 [Candidatus Polarisedimenticolaceae bacterium]|nr:hypothetical protein [Candidatus Polarisedimenticolaceae bacterium]
MSHPPARTLLQAEQVSIPPGHAWHRLSAIPVGLALLGAVGLALAARGHAEDVLHSWLVAFLFFLSLALGSLIFVVAHFAANAGWGVVVRRPAESVAATLPLFALLFLPVLVGMNHLYHWTDAAAMAGDPLLRWKQPYLNSRFFVGRAVLYFGVWSWLALYFLRSSRAQDRTGDPEITRRLRRVSGPAIVLFALTTTFAAIDWAMSLTPHWYSTMFGVYFFSGSLMGAFALLAVMIAAMRQAGLLRRVLTVGHFHDVGKLLFAMVCFWSYIAFSQYFLIWYANIPEELTWYAARMHGSWKTASQVLAVGHFALPFLFLLPDRIKRRPATLVAGAVWMLAMHYLDLFWVVMPAHRPAGFSLTLADAAACLAVGGVFFAALGWVLRRGALVPYRDPRLLESLTYDSA